MKNPNVAAEESIYCDSVATVPRGPGPALEDEATVNSVGPRDDVEASTAKGGMQYVGQGDGKTYRTMEVRPNIRPMVRPTPAKRDPSARKTRKRGEDGTYCPSWRPSSLDFKHSATYRTDNELEEKKD